MYATDKPNRLLPALVVAGAVLLGAVGSVHGQSLPTTAELFSVPAATVAPISAGSYALGVDGANVFAPLEAARGSLAPLGSTTLIDQIGTDNFTRTAISGPNNLQIVAQSGQNNRAVQAIEGSSSAMLLVQSGSNNSTLQASQGNRNSQIVGIGGQNNTLAYLQSGDDLRGALNVGGVNSSVLAIQTGVSGNYLMPTGLTGLNNQVVVVVPGRMYVFDRGARR